MLCLYIRLLHPLRCTSVPNRGGVRSGSSPELATAFNNSTGILYPFYTTLLKVF
nr:MAG TPA: hypothetical protein [Bacteriophage sp.]